MMNFVFKDAIFVNYQYVNIAPNKMIKYQILFVMNVAKIINVIYVKIGLTQYLAPGNKEADIMFIGEGPGADEDSQGLPFVGKARTTYE